MRITSADIRKRAALPVLSVDDEGEDPENEEYFGPGFEEDPTKWTPKGWHEEQADTMNQRIGDTEWEQVPDDEKRPETFVAYRKTLEVPMHEEAPGMHFRSEEDSAYLEFYVAISPASLRSNLELERAETAERNGQSAKTQKEKNTWFDRAVKHREAAERFAEIDGWEYDLEVQFNDNFIFHRERLFRSRPTAGSFPLSGSGLSKAMAQASQFIDQEIDNKTLGEFFEMVRQTKTTGPARLSSESPSQAEQMVTAASSELEIVKRMSDYNVRLQQYIQAALDALQSMPGAPKPNIAIQYLYKMQKMIG